MAETKWTPGPWAVQRFRTGTLGQRIEEMSEALGVFRPSNRNGPDDHIATMRPGTTSEADACLIAAAPAMAAVLTDINARVEQCTYSGGLFVHLGGEDVAAIRYALSLARGEAP